MSKKSFQRKKASKLRWHMKAQAGFIVQADGTWIDAAILARRQESSMIRDFRAGHLHRTP